VKSDSDEQVTVGDLLQTLNNHIEIY